MCGMGYGESCAFVTSNRRIAFCGCDGIEKYSASEIALRLSDGFVRVIGNSLAIDRCCGGEITVTGAVNALLWGDFDAEKNT